MEIKGSLNLGSACYHSVQDILSFSCCLKLYKLKFETTMLPIVLYGSENWCLTSGEQHRLRVPENRLLKVIFGSQRKDMIGGYRNLHNEEINKFWSLPNISVVKSRTMSWTGHVAHVVDKKSAYRILVGKWPLEGNLKK
jgi:hypothetical protein